MASRAAQRQAILDDLQHFQAGPIDAQDIDDKIEALEMRIVTRIQASTRNNIARIQNSTRCSGYLPLVPLVHAVTGNAIEGFPATIDVLNTLTGPGVTAILRALEEPETGTVEECRRRLLIAVGVVVLAVSDS